MCCFCGFGFENRFAFLFVIEFADVKWVSLNSKFVL